MDGSLKRFSVIATDPSSAARRGELHTLHGTVQTPVFMPVGTQGSVKALTPKQIEETGAQIILGNTYHLNLRPGADTIKSLGGLHKFMHWEKPILTDSGGFQAFSLSKLRKITEEGVTFASHLDGSQISLTPQSCLEIQTALGSDIAMVLDICAPYPAEERDVADSNATTIRWAREFLGCARDTGFIDSGHHVFGIVQGGIYDNLRRSCAEALAEMNFPGYAIGGVSVGEPEPEMLQQVAASTPFLPKDKPRYVMGVGTPPQLLKMIALGVDMFDCVMPTRLARHGTVFTPTGTINLRNEKYKLDSAPIVEGLDNYTCHNFSRAYLRHLHLSGEMLASTLLSIHNLHFFQDLMQQARQHLEQGDFTAWSHDCIARYEAGEGDS
ncbi:MAG: tRNA guanosine(34) transglycosylase Tgt [Bacteroidales bacterium]|nr:tRNA guanosine(34) transglycosylase Tgt [Bacteroidales bacterium]